MGNDKQVLILGIGNVLWADEGFGVRAVEALHQCYAFPSNVSLMDGGTQGLYLLQHVQSADMLVIFDAVDYGLEPGSLKLIQDTDVPKFMGAKKMSMHQTGFQEVLAAAQLLGSCPQEILLIGVQPQNLEDYGGSLSSIVKGQIEPALQAALSYLKENGVQILPRDAPLPDDEFLSDKSLDMTAYEGGRPSAEDACRFGDARVLFSGESQG